MSVTRFVSNMITKVDGMVGSDLERKVKEATNNENWGASGSLKQEIARETFDYQGYREIMPILWKRLGESGHNWRMVFKTLSLLDYLIKNGAQRLVDECRERSFHLRALQDFRHYDEQGRDRGGGIRELSKTVCELLQDEQKLRELRQDAKDHGGKFKSIRRQGFGTETGGGGYDSYSRDYASTGSKFDTSLPSRTTKYHDEEEGEQPKKEKKKGKKKKHKTKTVVEDDFGDFDEEPVEEVTEKKKKKKGKKKQHKSSKAEDFVLDGPRGTTAAPAAITTTANASDDWGFGDTPAQAPQPVAQPTPAAKDDFGWDDFGQSAPVAAPPADDGWGSFESQSQVQQQPQQPGVQVEGSGAAASASVDPLSFLSDIPNDIGVGGVQAPSQDLLFGGGNVSETAPPAVNAANTGSDFLFDSLPVSSSTSPVTGDSAGAPNQQHAGSREGVNQSEPSFLGTDADALVDLSNLSLSEHYQHKPHEKTKTGPSKPSMRDMGGIGMGFNAPPQQQGGFPPQQQQQYPRGGGFPPQQPPQQRGYPPQQRQQQQGYGFPQQQPPVGGGGFGMSGGGMGQGMGMGMSGGFPQQSQQQGFGASGSPYF